MRTGGKHVARLGSKIKRKFFLWWAYPFFEGGKTRMKVDRKTKEEAIIFLGKKINIANSAELKEILQSLCTESYQTITVDFSRTRIIDSSCLGILLMFQKKLKEKKGEIVIINVTSDYIRRMFALIHLSKVINIRQSTL